MAVSINGSQTSRGSKISSKEIQNSNFNKCQAWVSIKESMLETKYIENKNPDKTSREPFE